MTLATAVTEDVSPNKRLRALISGVAKYLAGIVLCLTPLTALIVLGWLSRKTANDVRSRRSRQKPQRWPNWMLSDDGEQGGLLARWTGGLVANLQSGAKAWLSVLLLTLPFSLVWLTGWSAGWENSFNKGYEQSGVWPIASFSAVFLSLPVLVLLPMAIAHQAVTERIFSALDFRHLITLVRASGWQYLALTALVGFGFIGVLGARALPVFAEQMSERVASGLPQEIEEYAAQFKLTMTALLFTSLLAVRHVMARVYATAITNNEKGRTAGRTKSALILILASSLWLFLIFFVHLGQFLNYYWWSWINQPAIMLPWLGILR